MEDFGLMQRIAVMILPLVLAVTVHEAAHGWVADKLGDSTARAQGRITFNPLSHIDFLGTIVVPMVMLLLTGFLFGWAKPVPVNFSRLKHPKRDMALVALAGPGVNLLMAVAWSLILLFAHPLLSSSQWLAVPVLSMAVAGVFLNLVLMALNLLPVPPLDGSRVMMGILPNFLARLYARLEPFGLFIVVGLLVLGVIGAIIGPVVFSLIDILPGASLVHAILPALLA